MSLEAGDLVLIPFPYTDQTGQKKRPALTLTPSWYNNDHEDALFAYVTSVAQRDRDPYSIPLVETDLETGRLVRRSWVRTDKIFTLEQQIILKTVARISRASMDQIRDCLEALLVRSDTKDRPHDE